MTTESFSLEVPSEGGRGGADAMSCYLSNYTHVMRGVYVLRNRDYAREPIVATSGGAPAVWRPDLGPFDGIEIYPETIMLFVWHFKIALYLPPRRLSVAMAPSRLDGAVPPPVDGAPEVSTGIAPVSDSVPVTNNATLAGQDWGGSPDANANAAAWAAYQQQQYAYHPQYSGGEWSAYHTACAAQWQQHNEAQAAAAAAGPSQEQLARVAAMFAEKLAAVENERGAGAASKGSVGTKPACTNTPQTETQVDVTTEKHRNRKSKSKSTAPSYPHSSNHPPPPVTRAPPSPPPPPAETSGDVIPEKSARQAQKSHEEKIPKLSVLVPRQIPPLSCGGRNGSNKPSDDAVPRRERSTTWQDVAREALQPRDSKHKPSVNSERSRLAIEIEMAQSRLDVSAARETRRHEKGDTHKRSGRSVSETRSDERNDHWYDRKEKGHGSGSTRDRDAKRVRGETEKEEKYQKTKRKSLHEKDVAFWERHYAEKFGMEVSGGLRRVENETGHARVAEDAENYENSSPSRERETPSSFGRDSRRADADEGGKETKTSPPPPLLRRARGRTEGSPGRHDGTRYDTPAPVWLTRAHRPPTLKGARSARAWGCNGTPPVSPGKDEHEYPQSGRVDLGNDVDRTRGERLTSSSKEDGAGYKRQEDRRDRNAREDGREVRLERSPRAIETSENIETTTEPTKKSLPTDKSLPTPKERRGRSPARTVRLSGVTTREELLDNVEAGEILKETEEECQAFGAVVSIHATMPSPLGENFDSPDVGTVFVLFENPRDAEMARRRMHGRLFADRPVTAEVVDGTPC